MLVGLALSASYSLRPVRVADRGALAALLLPACFVAVPYLLGRFAAGPAIAPRDLLVLLIGVPHPSTTLAAGYLAGIGAALVLLRELAGDPGRRREERIISTIAILGRGLLVLLLAQLALLTVHWPPAAQIGILAGLALVTELQAMSMYRHGPIARLTLPAQYAPHRRAITRPAK